ncbi:hypothetical protein AK973_3809 [Pseudomonas brassicacearum]|nr:hypothetical protein AK973_3809 [Pseudomonas brassicacearum]
MLGIIWKRLLVVNWPLSELSNLRALQNEAFQWSSPIEVKIAGRGAGRIRGLRIAMRAIGCAMTGLRH